MILSPPEVPIGGIDTIFTELLHSGTRLGTVVQADSPEICVGFQWPWRLVFERGMVFVRRAAEELIKSTICVRNVPLEDHEQCTRPERPATTILTTHDLQTTYSAVHGHYSFWSWHFNNISHMHKFGSLSCTLLEFRTACLTPHVLPTQPPTVCSVVEH